MVGFNVNKLDDAIHGRLRLGVMAYLMDAEAADFNELKAVLEATQGNLSVHLRKLEEAGYVEIVKAFQGRKPLTRVHITPAGRKAFASYIEVLSGLVDKG
ncbi:transcriptional regulator [Asticcacaulis sp. YBE204]|uniref:winged helix-turn-helix domain-containing protein n=1 Tax=Asticcacaulis sp. YBE204 TaxID=1282363 RepID=UPI0003C3D9C7|nr:transcriptional regulator [Asticcacaulis sp. YBE204]ESQ80535.1 transcriptional regulator [Asticcacaulis sp. YBE204]